MMDIAKDGNMSKSAAIAKIASAALGGLQNNIIELCIGVITENTVQISDSLKKISLELNVDFNLLESIMEIVLNEYNPDQGGQHELLGQVEIQIKKFFRKLIPTMNVEPLGDLLHVIVKGDPKRLIKYLEEIEGVGVLVVSDEQRSRQTEIYAEVFKMLIYQYLDDRDGVKKEIIGFLDSVTSLESQI